MPKDTAIMAEMTRDLQSDLHRPMDYLHPPVPKDRTDDGYFTPLAELSLPAETSPYYDLIHHADAAGDQVRTAAARKVVSRFGVATECDLGRADPARVPGLLAAHRQVVADTTP